MKLRFLLLLAVSASMYGQAVRYDGYVTQPSTNVPQGAAAALMTMPNAIVTICAFPAVGDPCTNTVPIYEDQLTTTQMTQPIHADALGRYGFWITPNQYSYSVQTQSGRNVGTFPLSLTSPAGPAIPFLGIWDPTVVYLKGQAVTFDGNLYISLLDSNLNNQPDTSPTYWALENGGSVVVAGQLDVQGSDTSGTSLHTTGMKYTADTQNRTFNSIKPNNSGGNNYQSNNFNCNLTQNLDVGPNSFFTAGCNYTYQTNLIPTLDPGPSDFQPFATLAQMMGGTHIDYGAGLTAGLSVQVYKFGINDTQGMNLDISHVGGSTGGGNEGFEQIRGTMAESDDTFVGGISSVTSQTQIKADIPIHAAGQQGDGRMLHNTSEANVATNVYVSSLDTGPFSGGLVVAFGGGTIPSPYISTAICGQTDDAIPTPLLSTGGYTSMTFHVVCAGPNGGVTMRGVPVVGGLITFNSFQHEQTRITAVTSLGSNAYAITAPLRFVHYGGGLIFQGKGTLAFSLYANDVTTGGSSPVLHYPKECVGVIDATHAACGDWQSGGFSFNGLGAVATGSATVSSATNTAGVVSFTLNNVENNATYTSEGATLYLSSTVNPDFEGPCTGLHYDFATYTVTCNQASSTGETNAGTLTIHLGDTPTGYTKGDLWQAVQVIDVRNPTTKALDQTLIIEDNDIPFANGNVVMEDHGWTTGQNSIHLIYDAKNPNVFDGSYVNRVTILQGETAVGTSDSNIRGNAVERVGINVDPNRIMGLTPTGSSYPIFGYVLQGLVHEGLTLTSAPYPSGSVAMHVGCPVLDLGCATPNYSYYIVGGSVYDDFTIGGWLFHPNVGLMQLSNMNLGLRPEIANSTLYTDANGVVSGVAGVSISGSSCTITAISHGAITAATCAP